MKPSSLIPYVAILALQFGAMLALLFAVDVRVSDVLPVTEELPGQVGEWTGEGIWFCLNPDCDASVHRAFELEIPGQCPACGQPLNGGSRAEMGMLPPDTRVRKMQYRHPSGAVLTASYVVSGKGRSSLHRPQVCLTAAGHEIEGKQVLGIPLGSDRRLRVTVLDLEQKAVDPTGQPVLRPSFYAYWFAGPRRETPYHVERMAWMAADKVFQSTASRWAYLAVSGPRAPGSQAHRQILQDFLVEFHSLVRPEADR